MPEWAEVKISADYINTFSKNKKYTNLYHVEKGNNAILDTKFSDFILEADTNGKELILSLKQANTIIPIHVFMGMSGSWKYTSTLKWSDVSFTRLRLDDDTGNSMLLSGGFLGPKYSIGAPFKGTKRGPDPVKQFELFKDNVLKNLHKKAFEKPIYEVLLNQEYFNGIGNYLRSTILYYMDANPFITAREFITSRIDILEMCRDVPLKAYELNGGQLRDWGNPFNKDSVEFSSWVFYQKGESIKDSNDRTFWYNKKWK